MAIVNRLVLIARVSTKDQEQNGYSLEAQEAKCRAWCEARGHELITLPATVTKAVSGAAVNRPDLDMAIDMIMSGKADGIIATKLDRVARSVHQLTKIAAQLSQYGDDLVIVDQAIDTTTPAGKLMFHVLGAVAEFERDLISERTKEGLAQLKAEGKRGGGRIPYGYSLRGGDVVINPREQSVIELVLDKRDEGLTYEEVADWLNKEGVQTPCKATRWHKEHVRRLVLRGAEPVL